MPTAINTIKEKAENNKKTLLQCTVFTFIWGLAAHAYMFLNNSFSHDSLNEFYAKIYGNDIRIAYGRIFVPAYRFITRGATALPWLIGLLALLYISLTVFLIVKLFNVTSKVRQALISGVLTVNVTVIAITATYIHDLDCDMMALLLSVIAVFLWNYNKKFGFLMGAPFVMLSMGFYQSYISVTVSLIIIYLIVALLNDKKFKDVMIAGIKSLVMIIAGGVLYLIAIKVVTFITGIPLASGDHTSLDRMENLSIKNIFYLISNGVKKTFPKVITPKSVYPDEMCAFITVTLFIITIFFIVKRLMKKSIGIPEAVLTVFLIAMLPVGMNISYVLSKGITHDVMLYSYCMFYILILLTDKFTFDDVPILSKVQKAMSIIVCVGILVLTWGNVQSANAVYLKKDFEYDANLSFFTRVVSDMEDCDRYIPGKTPVVIIGRPRTSLIPSPAFENVDDYTGAKTNYVPGVATWDYYKAYFGYVLMNPAVMAEEEDWTALRKNKVVKHMPSYPEDGSIKIVKGTLVVKLS